MSAIFLVLAMAAAPARGEAFARYLGPAIDGKPNCYAVGDRYAACVASDTSGLRRINVEPRAWLTHEEFDRDQALSHAEFLDIMTKLGRAVDVGAYQPDVAPQTNAITNGLYASIEEWTNAAVRKWIVDGKGTVLSFDVMFYRSVSGSVRMTSCQRVIDYGKERPESDCLEPALGPKYVTIDNEGYVVAPRDRRKFKPNEAVDIHAADLRN
ncbi:MAG: hypothetical protein QOI24_1887 [Acidobacteriota bacterium]|jgi:hypothetical protein|nr:hypothetical protein [Acidobacteriota bacterium]